MLQPHVDALACNAFHVGWIPLPDGVAVAAACRVALNHLGDHLGKQPALRGRLSCQGSAGSSARLNAESFL
jgi:hypothetical protein